MNQPPNYVEVTTKVTNVIILCGNEVIGSAEYFGKLKKKEAIELTGGAQEGCKYLVTYTTEVFAVPEKELIK